MPVTRVVYTADGWGEGELWFEGPRLVWHELPRPTQARPIGGSSERTRRIGRSPHPGGAHSTRHPLGSTIARFDAHVRHDSEPDQERIVNRMQSYFAGEHVDFTDVAVDLDDLTAFQRAVAAALRAVPYGEIVSYGELARAAGHPNAGRAAGTFCARNRYPLVLPCHRVVAAAGLGSYGTLGTAYKRRLLELEGVAV